MRSSLPLERLVPYLEQHVEGYRGPLKVQQFKFGQVGRSLPLTTSGSDEATQLTLGSSQIPHTCSRLRRNPTSCAEHRLDHCCRPLPIGSIGST